MSRGAPSTQVIGVSGAVGAGKSTLVLGLARALQASIVHFDNYEMHTAVPAGEIRDSLRQGADLDSIPMPRLAEDLRQLKAGRPVVDPATGARIEPTTWVLFETQFGRRHAATGQHIDFLIWIDTPLDVALARKLRQMTNDSRDPPAHLLSWLQDYLGNYLAAVAEMLRMQSRTVRADADVTLDGLAEPGTLLAQARAAIAARLTH